uniref:Uncharacterized protein n=1 Tax=Oryza barthii TaxID=65489 RepID=A0A0D3GS34_9ORYZ
MASRTATLYGGGSVPCMQRGAHRIEPPARWRSSRSLLAAEGGGDDNDDVPAGGTVVMSCTHYCKRVSDVAVQKG